MTQRDRSWLAQASKTEIAAATVAGELQTVLAGGDPPSAAVQEEIDRSFAAFANRPKVPQPNPGQGSNGDSGPRGQLDRETLKTLTPAQIVEAQSQGLLNDLLGVRQ